ncbi:MAG: hypothetical protein JRH15_16890, partial [Deltaproteobacteria bacterium]|nr:hypothetical protein [Deltaproteobacteria bacterium]
MASGAHGPESKSSGKSLRIALLSNPSHLESVDPVVAGFVRARQEKQGDIHGKRIMPLVLYGDAAFAGQEIVAEVLNMS